MPAQGSGIAVSRAAPAGYVRALRNPLYDTDELQAAATNQVRLYSVPQGQLNASAAVKTEADTNMTIGGQLANPQLFDLFGFQFKVEQLPAAIPVANDYYLVYSRGVFEFSFGTQRVWLQLPVDRIPEGPALEVDGAVVAVMAIRNGRPSVKEYYPFVKPNGKPYRIKATETFGVRLFWPSGAVTMSAVTLIRSFMVGIWYVGL